MVYPNSESGNQRSGADDPNSHHLPTGNRDRSLWERQTLKYDRLHPRLKLVVEEASRLEGSKVLDIGCGVGTVGKALGDAYEYFGLDIVNSPGSKFPQGTYASCNFNENDLPFSEGTFDIAICSGIIEYIDKPSAFLNQVNGLIRDGGGLVVTYFNMNHVSRSVPSLFGRKPVNHALWKNFLSLDDFGKLLASTGFQITAMRPLNLVLGRSKSIEETHTFLSGTHRFKRLWPLLAQQMIFVAVKT